MRKIAFILFTFSLFFGLHTQKTSGKTAFILEYHIDMTPWEEVADRLPRKSKFTVIDVETGKRFKVQRRAGSSHADVQPLTHKDTKIMKEIYGGSWSWKRRAVLVYSDNLLIAGSMHGMPHGAGALQNGFPGHFCIHYKGSTTHKTDSPDLSHHLMILKAGGNLDSFLNELQPQPLVDAFLAGVKNNDPGLVRKTITEKKANLNSLDKIEALRWKTTSSDKDTGPFIKEVNADLQLYIKDSGPLKAEITFTVVKTSPDSAWKVDGSPLWKLLK
ncbi:hypothetical protein [Bacillus sp. SG-1]|uniref:hypothetical protein n=1 Tax=Bacillus sp. SG-1 TaxID=161544 RepID=UPI00015440C7|nr:hypothetical protein [Bacillus sp. SG-1]EDL65939.1 hypothetical protein BSG1_16825 [Bacillus sp. SG-1]